MNKNILLVVYVFPPAPGIGGRRWAKFAKYLSRMDFTVHVICNVQQTDDVSLWYDDVKDNPKIIVHGIQQQYPAILNTNPSTIFDKIKYKIALFRLRRLTKGSLFDRSFLWGENFLQLAEKVMAANHIWATIVSIAPMHQAKKLIELKAKFPNTKFIADFRDPWANGVGYGFPQIEKSRQTFEENNEQTICDGYDLITSSVRGLNNYFHAKYQLPTNKFYLLEHAIDVDDFSTVKVNEETKICRIIYNGNLYEGLENVFHEVFDTLKTIDNTDLQLDFFIPFEKKEYFTHAKGLEKSIHILKPLPPKKFFVEMATADFVLVIYPDKNADYFTTKFTEIIHQRVPIIFICNEGFVSKFISENRLGIWLTKNNIKQRLPKILEDRKMKNYNDSFDTSSFTFTEITTRFVEKIKEI